MNTSSYPVVQFLVARGRSVSFVMAIAILMASFLLAYSAGSVWIALAGVAAAGVVLGLLLSYIEVLHIIADTLLPKY